MACLEEVCLEEARLEEARLKEPRLEEARLEKPRLQIRLAFVLYRKWCEHLPPGSSWGNLPDNTRSFLEASGKQPRGAARIKRPLSTW